MPSVEPILLKAIFDNAAAMIISTTVDGIITGFNQKAEILLGYDAHELINKQSPAVFHDLQEIILRASEVSKAVGYNVAPGFGVFIELSKHNLPNEFEWTYISKSGRRFPVLLSISALRNSEEDIIGYLGIAQDISKMKLLENELTQQIELTEQQNILKKAIFDNAGAMIISTNKDGIITGFNSKAEMLLGYTANELKGKKTPALFHLEEEIVSHSNFVSEKLGYYVPPGFNVFIEFSKYNMPNEFEWTYVNKSQRRFPVLLSISSLRNTNNEIIGYLGIAQDLSSFKKNEALVIQQNKNLKDIAFQQSHLLRRPIANIKGIIDLLKLETDKIDNSQLKEYIEMLNLSVEDTNQIIQSILYKAIKD
jgi:PAS domain-containing protein